MSYNMLSQIYIYKYKLTKNRVFFICSRARMKKSNDSLALYLPIQRPIENSIRREHFAKQMPNAIIKQFRQANVCLLVFHLISYSIGFN